MKLSRQRRFWSIVLMAIVATLMVPALAYADGSSPSAEAKIKQTDPGTDTPFGGTPYAGEPCGFTTFGGIDFANPGMSFEDVKFMGEVTKVHTYSDEKDLRKLLHGSELTVTYDGFICFMGGPDINGDIPFAGMVDGMATLLKRGNKGGTLDLAIMAPLSGTVNQFTGALSAEWEDPMTGDIGGWVVTVATGRYAAEFTPGLSMGGLTAEASRKNASKPEKGTATFFLP